MREPVSLATCLAAQLPGSAKASSTDLFIVLISQTLGRTLDSYVGMSEPCAMQNTMNGDLEQLGERIAEQAAHLDAAMYRFLTDLREFDERGGWHVQGASSCAHWLAWRVGWDLVTGRERVRVARKLAEFPVIGDALRRGEVSYSKVRALLRVATPENEALLLDHARRMPASQLEKLSTSTRSCSATARTRIP